MMEWFSDNGLLLGLALLDGLAYAALVFMVAVGLNLVFGVLRIVNVAHGSLFAIGGLYRGLDRHLLRLARPAGLGGLRRAGALGACWSARCSAR